MNSRSGNTEVLKLVLISLALVFAISAFAIVLLRDEGAGGAHIARTIILPDLPPPPPPLDEEQERNVFDKMREEERQKRIRQEIEELKDRQKRADEAVAKLRAKYEKDGKLPEKITLETPTDRPRPMDPNEEGIPNTAPLVVYPHQKRVEFDAQVLIDKTGGYLPEVLMAGPRGRLHESVLLTYINPYDLWQALALLGLKQTYPARGKGDMVDIEGDRVIMEVQYKDKDGKSQRRRLEDFIYHFGLRAHMPYEGWVYVGSRFGETREGEMVFIAGQTEDIISTWHWPVSIIDNPLKEAGDDTMYAVYEGVVPPKGTKLRVIITPDEEYNKKHPEPQPINSKSRW